MGTACSVIQLARQQGDTMESFQSEQRFDSAEHMATVIRATRPRYEALLSALGSMGTEVLRDRVVERDQDCPPYNFIRSGAVVEFVFPPVPVEGVEDASEVIDPTPGYSLNRERTQATYDKSLVEGHVRVTYGDADNRASVAIEDMLDASQLPEGAATAITDFQDSFEVA